ncbi:MAG TPA: DNA repair protein RadC [Candidatus Paceibacterota bacterium]|nr:DNA repair protein RadC [Candidatus Paceibacterota bacterium]
MQTYSIRSADMVLDAPHARGRTYILKLRDLPPAEKPREKLLALGASALSVAELISLVLGNGTTKEDVRTMSERIVREYGERSLAGDTDPEKLSKDLGIPLVKAMQIAACAELGRRFFSKNERGLVVVRTASDVFDYLKDMRDLSKEHLRGLYLDNQHKVIHDEVISIGTIDANLVHPREVFKPALEYSAVAVILAHNHPSGSTEPSEADIGITKQLVQSGKIMGIQLLDHVIITRTAFASIPVSYD